MSASERRPSTLRRIGIACLAALAAGPAVASGADRASLPGDGFLPGWKQSGPSRAFIGPDLFNHIDGGAELFLEFGFVRLLLQAYGDGVSELTASVYEMESASAALGIYLMKMGEETPFRGIAARNSSEDAQMTILKGRHFIQIDNLGDPPAPREVAVSLANAVLAPLAEEEPVPILDRLPADNRVAGSERLIRGPYGLQPYVTLGEGDVLKLGGEIFAALAEYTAAGGTRFRRMIVPYPDAAAAAAALESLRANLDPYLKIVEAGADALTFVDFKKRYGAIARVGNVLDIRFDLVSLD